jgi:hypothetical protein
MESKEPQSPAVRPEFGPESASASFQTWRNYYSAPTGCLVKFMLTDKNDEELIK